MFSEELVSHQSILKIHRQGRFSGIVMVDLLKMSMPSYNQYRTIIYATYTRKHSNQYLYM